MTHSFWIYRERVFICFSGCIKHVTAVMIQRSGYYYRININNNRLESRHSARTYMTYSVGFLQLSEQIKHLIKPYCVSTILEIFPPFVTGSAWDSQCSPLWITLYSFWQRYSTFNSEPYFEYSVRNLSEQTWLFTVSSFRGATWRF